MKKRIFAIFLALMMVITTLPVTTNASMVQNYEPEALRKLKMQADEVLKNDKGVHTFIVEVTDPAALSMNTNKMRSSSFRKVEKKELDRTIETRLASQERVLDEILGGKVRKRRDTEEKRGISSFFQASNSKRKLIKTSNDRNNLRRYRAVLNGFALKMTYSEAKRVATLPEVTGVSLSLGYKMTPSMIHSREIVKAQIANEKSYDGRGRVVAILDTGIDVTHPDLRLDDGAESFVKYNEEKMNAKIKENALFGKFENLKVPYVYNYADRDFNMATKDANHGQHIAGTIAGNGLKKDGPVDERGVVGIVPNAQILAMRVFGAGNPSTNTDIYVEAIDDAVILGADSINMSLGSYSGAAKGDAVMNEAIKNANAAGSIVVFAGGNDGFSMSGVGETGSDMMDYATLGSPGASKDVFTVASYNNDKIIKDPYKVIIGSKKYEAYPSVPFAKGNFEFDKNFDVVDCGLGLVKEVEKDGQKTKIDNFEGKDLKGKIALIQRGDGTFTEKIVNAQNAGAVAVIMGNNKVDSLRNMTIDDTVKIPAVLVFLNDYKEIKTKIKTEQVSIHSDGKDYYEDEHAGRISDFSSWGPTPNLGLKPEITAPGGNIRSFDNTAKYDGQTYTYMSGTSMATPHVAGGIAAVNGMLNKHSEITFGKTERASLIRAILMNTATPIKVPGQGDKLFSVRLQGAGLMDLDKATNPNVVTVVDNGEHESKGEPKVELRQISETKLPVNLLLKNYTDKDVTYDVSYVVQTDLLKEDGKLSIDSNTYVPFEIAREKFGEVTVSKKSTRDFTNTISFTEGDWAKNFPNGYFVDAFVIFTPKDKSYPELSIPMLAFKGNWEENVPIFEKFIDDFKLTEKRPYWVEQGFTKADENGKVVLDSEKLNNTIGAEIPATMILANTADPITRAFSLDAVGRNNISKEFTKNFAFSPNGDNIQDYVQFKGVFLRNFSNFNLQVKKENTLIRTIENAYRADGRKTAGTVNMAPENFNKAYSESQWTWDGKDANGMQVEEGTYKLVASARINDNPKAKKQELVKEILVDRTSPEVSDVKITSENGTKKISATVKDALSKVQSVIVVTKNKEGKSFFIELKREKDTNVYSYVEPVNKLDKLNNFNEIDAYVRAFDWAGNTKDVKLSSAKEIGHVTINKVGAGENSVAPSNNVLVFALNDKDEKVGSPMDKDSLPVGKYKVEMESIPAGYTVQFDPATFEITNENKAAEVTVTFTKVADTNLFGKLIVNVIFPADYNGNFRLFAAEVTGEGKDQKETGRIFSLDKSISFGDFSYEAKLPAGKYIVRAESTGDKPVQFAGYNEATIKPQETYEMNLQVAPRGSMTLPIYIVSKDGDVIENLIDENDFENILDKDGKVARTIVHNISKYLDITHVSTGEKLKDMKNLDLVDKADTAFISYFNNDPNAKYKEIDLLVVAPFGEYQVEVKNPDFAKYLVLNKNFNIKAVKWNEIKGKFQGSEIILKDPYVYGTINVKRELLGNGQKEITNPVEVYNSKGELIKPTGDLTWAGLPQDDYEVVTFAKDGITPERNSKKVSITPQEQVQELTFRYRDLNTLPTVKNTSLAVGVYGDELPDGKSIKVILHPKRSGEKVKTITLTKDQLKSINQEVVRLGSYTVEIILPEGYDLNNFFFSGENFRDILDRFYDNRTKVDLTFDKGFTQLEFSIAKRNRIPSSVEIKSIGLPEGRLVKYTLEKDGKTFESINGIFRGLEAGTYTLKVEAPDGYQVKTYPKTVEAADGKTSKIEVLFEKLPNVEAPKRKVDKRALEAEINKEREVKASDKYIYALKDLKREYDEALEAAKALLNREATQKEVDQALNRLIAAREALNGVAPEKPVPNDPEPNVPGQVGPISGGDWRYPEYPIYNYFRTSENKTETSKKEETKVKTVKNGITIPSPYLTVNFTDVLPNLSEAVNFLASRGIMVGTGENKFSPNSPMSRAMVVATLYRISEDKNFDRNAKSFTDVKSTDWFYESVLWAREKGIIAGYEEGDFRPNKNLSRQEFAVIIAQFLKDHGIKMPEIEKFAFKDVKDVPEWSKDAVEIMKKIGLIDGKDENRYKPYSEYTRGELATTLYKLIKFCENN